MKNRYIVGLISLSLASYLYPAALFAAPLPGTLPFGGLVSYSVPCTCPGSIGNIWIFLAPLYLGGPVPVTGSVVYVPYASQLYSWFNIGVPTTWHLGSYIPGVQACWMVVPPPATGCFPLLSAGVITQVGTSIPGGWAF